MSARERKVLAVLQEGLPKSTTPFKDMAKLAGIETKELLTRLKNWSKDGKLRRIGAIVSHFKVGAGAGAMVVWKAEPERVEEVGKMLAGFAKVSHAYERETRENWPYNIYTMVHAGDADELAATIKEMNQAAGIRDYRVLTTARELKKAPPTYIISSDPQIQQEDG
jgi:DNA-binding Lrp family transcriptional regulator